jgi:polo-like kinase 1
MGAIISFINEKREFFTYKLSGIEKCGSTKELASRFRYARNMIDRLMGGLPKSGASSGRPKVTA